MGVHYGNVSLIDGTVAYTVGNYRSAMQALTWPS